MSGLVRDPRLDRLAKMSRVFAHLTTLLLALMVAGGLGIWLREDWVRAAVLPNLGLSGVVITLNPWIQTLGLLLTAVPLLILAFGLFQMRCIFVDFATGRTVTQTLARRLELFGGAVLAQALLSPVIGAALSVVVTMGAVGRHTLAFNISSQEMLFALFGVLLAGVGVVMREAARIAEDHAGFV